MPSTFQILPCKTRSPRIETWQIELFGGYKKIKLPSWKISLKMMSMTMPMGVAVSMTVIVWTGADLIFNA